MPERPAGVPVAAVMRPMLAEPLGVVEPAPRDAARGRDPAGRVATGRAGRHQPLDLGERRREPLVLGGDAVRLAAAVACAAAARPDDEHELPARRDRARRPPRPRARRACPRTIASWSLVSSRQTAAGRVAAAGRGQVRERRRDPPGRLVDDGATLVGRDPGQPLAALAPRARQEALERPARPGHARSGDRRQHGRGARERHDRAALGRPRRDELAARVADRRRPGIGHEREVRAAAQVLEQRRRPAPARSGRGSSSSSSSMPWRASRRCVSRVSSAAISGTARRTSSARRVMSPRLPIGVATTIERAAGIAHPRAEPGRRRG